MPYDADENYRKLPIMYRRRPEYYLKEKGYIPGPRLEVIPALPEPKGFKVFIRHRKRAVILLFNVALIIGVIIWFQSRVVTDPGLFAEGSYHADLQAYQISDGAIHAQVMISLETGKTALKEELTIEWAYGEGTEGEEFKALSRFTKVSTLPPRVEDPLFFVLDDKNPPQPLPSRVGLRLGWKNQHILVWKGLKSGRKD